MYQLNPVKIRAGEIGFCCEAWLRQRGMDAELDLSAQGCAVQSRRSLRVAPSKNLSSEACANYGRLGVHRGGWRKPPLWCRRHRDKI